MNLEHHRKTAKRLLRAFRAGELRALQRAEAVLSERSQDRFGLTDAQYVVAVELGYRSWPDLTQAAKLSLAHPVRGERPEARDRNHHRLPIVDAGPGESVIVTRIAEASRAFYRDLLESEG